MERRIGEADWKRLRRLEPIARDRFCQRVLDEVGRLAGGPAEGSHARYLAVFRLVQTRDEELAAAFDDVRRSTALLRLARMRSLGVVTDEELAEFGPDTRGAIAVLLDR